MRTLAIVGHIRPRTVLELARWCSWGDHPFTAEDAIKANRGAYRTHGLCPSCEAKHFPKDAA